MLRTHLKHVFIALSFHFAAANANAIRLSDLNQCPDSKPLCAGERCAGPTTICENQYKCTNETPLRLATSDDHNVILAGCPCCPEPRNTACSSNDCLAEDGTRTCVAEQLRGCQCWTEEDLKGWRDYWEKEEGHLWDAAPDVEDIEIEGEEDYGSDEDLGRLLGVLPPLPANSSQVTNEAGPTGTSAILAATVLPSQGFDLGIHYQFGMISK